MTSGITYWGIRVGSNDPPGSASAHERRMFPRQGRSVAAPATPIALMNCPLDCIREPWSIAEALGPAWRGAPKNPALLDAPGQLFSVEPNALAPFGTLLAP